MIIKTDKIRVMFNENFKVNHRGISFEIKTEVFSNLVMGNIHTPNWKAYKVKIDNKGNVSIEEQEHYNPYET